ncbi:MAG: sugar transporter [Verrucomicrobiaceae bacterium]|nr:sugar transporter [Verrucomicrobiaceae bacterium]
MNSLFLPAAARALLLAGVAFLPITVVAEDAALALADTKDGAKTLRKITVSATKSARDVAEVTSVVDVIDGDTLEATLSRDLKDSLRYLPGCNNTGRIGLSSIDIRGLEDNRVLIEVDCARIADTLWMAMLEAADAEGPRDASALKKRSDAVLDRYLIIN